MSSDWLLFRSEFLPDVVVVVVFKYDAYYEEIKKHFRRHGPGFTVLENRCVFIDGEALIGETDKSALKFIEAHEISHILLNHGEIKNPEHEAEADIGAYILLENGGHAKSCEMVVKYFKERHGKIFNTEEVLSVRKKMGFN